MRSQAVRVHRQLSQWRPMFHRIELWLDRDYPAVAQAIGVLAQKLDAIDSEVGSVRERARPLLDEMAAKMTDITSRRLFTLSIVTACLLPPTLVTGFFGMNTKDMPFQTTDDGTWLACWWRSPLAPSSIGRCGICARSRDAPLGHDPCCLRPRDNAACRHAV
jgi:zinc transporter